MSKKYGITLVSHVPEVADGVKKLLSQVAKDVDIIVLPEVWVGPYDVNKFALFSEPYPGPATTALADV